MFSNKEQLRKRTPENGTDRESFLSLLVDEFLNTPSFDAKCQVVANLANFAYDPINYGYIRAVGVLDIFLYILKNETNHKLLQFAIAGICNLANDAQNAEYILTHAGLRPIIALLNSESVETVTDAITSLIYLYSEETKAQITDAQVIKLVQDLNKMDDKRFTNLTTIFLHDICGKN